MIIEGLLGVVIGSALGYFIPGYLLISTFFRDELTRLEKIIFSVAVSFGILHVVMTTMAVLRINLSFYSILSVELIITSISIILWLKMKGGREKNIDIRNLEVKKFLNSLKPYFKLDVFPFLLFTGIMIFLMLFNTIQMPIQNGYDGLVYEPISKFIFEQGHYPWPIFPDAIYAPQYAYVYEMRHILTSTSWMYMCYGSADILYPILVVLFFSIATLVALFSLSLRRNRNLHSAIIVTPLMLLTTIFVKQSTDIHNDILFLFFWVVATYSFYLSIGNKNKKFLVLSGINIGFLLITKIESLIFPLIIVIYLIADLALLRGIKNLKFPQKIKAIRWGIITLIIGITVSGIFFINNWALNGNPVFPFFTSIFGGDSWTANFLHIIDMEYRSHGISTYSLEYFLNRFGGFLRVGEFRYEPNPLVAIFCFLGFIILASNLRDKKDRFLLVNSLLFFLFWFFSADYGYRLLSPLYALLLVPFSSLASSSVRFSNHINNISNEGMNRLRRIKTNLKRNSGRYFKVICLLAIVLPTSTTILRLTQDNQLSNTLWESGGSDVDSYTNGQNVYYAAVGIYYVLQPDLGFFITHFLSPSNREIISELKYGDFYNVGAFINTELPQNAIILTTDVRAFYFSDRKMIWDGNNGINQIYLKEDIGKVLDMLKDYNITHILYATGPAGEKEREMMGLSNSTFMQNIDNGDIFKEVWRGNGSGELNLRGPIVLYEINQTSA